MKRVEFIYRIETEVEFTGRELGVLLFCARRHYDSVCKRAFEIGGFGWGWMQQFLHGGNDYESVVSFDLDSIESRFAERTVQVRATSREIDTCAKILELAQHTPFPEQEGFDDNIRAAAALFMALSREMREVREESQRLNGSTG